MKPYRFSFIIILLLINLSVFAQYSPEVDSLIKVVENQEIDTLKVNNLNTICWKLKYDDFEKSKEFGTQALELSKELKFKNGEALANKNLGGIYYLQGIYADAYIYYTESLRLYKEIDNKKGISKVVSNLGSIFSQQGDYEKAIDYFFQSLEAKKELKDTVGIAKLYNRIGVVYYNQGEIKYIEALDYYEKALKIYENLDYKIGIADSYYRIASIYTGYKEQKNDTALIYARKFLELSIELDNKGLMAEANQSIGNIYFKLKKNEKALIHLEKSLKLWDELGNLSGRANILLEIAKYHTENQNYKEAENYLLKSLKIVEQTGEPLTERDIYNHLYLIYNATNKYEKALFYVVQYFNLKDSLVNKEMENAITRLSVKNDFNSQIKEQKAEQEKMESEHKAKEKKAKVLIFAFLAGFIFMLGFALFIYKSLRDKKKANKLLEDKNAEINQQNEEIKTQNNEITKQKTEIEHQRDDIVASITYAQRIQKAVMPSQTFTDHILNKHFILFKPLELVSGDFFWIKQEIRNNIKYNVIVAADCTGHGVPGAFMSMLGTSSLNEIIPNDNLEHAGEILDKLRTKIKSSLYQEGKDKDKQQKDGMDLSLYILNTETNEIRFSGAYNPIYIIREKKNITPNEMETLTKTKNIKIHKAKKKVVINNKNHELIEIKANRQPIGVYIKERDFHNNIFQLKKNDTIYSFSDGYIDQFGGEKGNKLKSGNFKKILLEFQNKNMQEQKEILLRKFDEWKGDLHQIDDIIIIGLKIPELKTPNKTGLDNILNLDNIKLT